MESTALASPIASTSSPLAFMPERHGSAVASDLVAANFRIVVQSPPDPSLELSKLKRGLLERQANISPKFFYDAVGCALFDDICTLPEYYLTRTESAIFERYQNDIVRSLPSHAQWIDLGCGDGAKSREWIGAADAARYVGVDIACEWLATALKATAGQFPKVECIGVVTDFSEALSLREVIAERPESPSVFFYPGSSIGNFTTSGAVALLRSIRAHLGTDGCLLIGADLVKDAMVLEAAYNDSRGVTAAFNWNILCVVNRLLDADFTPGRFEHRAEFNPIEDRIEMSLHAKFSHSVRIGRDERRFDAGDAILTEYSHKYTVEGFTALLLEAGYGHQMVWTDDNGWFGLFLAQP